ncbi:glycerophosphoryl diester phosphodiesterase membrane domain-containing protein [Nonomuraea cavernae]|uniref:Membrane protein n=1 Tax=Nonomuraea cavernae TaxID=2045107 RepID=A0A918DMV5_9ACTN|nr:glycerophosphoryl diester phosphodiesterase membrane domain-containing protein [Nonomuraea cavernae]MCA2185757.1 glycerophosphoryl diester phosphodiesterase membrane domain-containing protein [Nonomuraea cavernae]GGO75729.1 membrane protein [Nonomuraea cavernae]
MSDGHGSTPETPPGWAAEQPPPYGAPQASPWTAPGPQQDTPQGAAQQGPPPHARPPYPQQPYSQQPPPGYVPPGYGPPGYGPMPHPPALRPGIIPLRPLGLGDILDGTIKLIRSNPKAVLGLSAVAALLGAVPVAVGQMFSFDSLRASLDPSTPVATYQMYDGLVAQYGGLFVSMAISFVVVTLLTGVLTRILGRAVFGGTMTAGEAWQLTRGRVPALFGVVGLMAVIMLVPLLALGGIIAALIVSGAAESSGGQAALVAITLVGLVLYLGYALFFKARFAFAAPAVVLEGRGPIDAMRRSWHLVTGDFWRVLGILLLTSVMVFFLAGILEIPFSIIGSLFGLLGESSGATIAAAVLIAVGGTLGAMLTYPFEAGVAGLLYADRRMRSEAFDLVLQTAAIEQQRQGWVHASADELWHPSNSASSTGSTGSTGSPESASPTSSFGS